jgi:hypothetical protein
MRCNVGYVAGRRIESAMLFETLDPHGHDLDIAGMACPSCRTAADSGGYCENCRIGFVNRMAFFTRLTYGLAQGRVMDRAALSCAVCRSNAEHPGWCDACACGMVGNVALTDRPTFDRTAAEYCVLLAAIDKTTTCEVCAGAMVVHRTCRRCRISYERPVNNSPGEPPATERHTGYVPST